jgi:hypothetical protein
VCLGQSEMDVLASGSALTSAQRDVKGQIFYYLLLFFIIYKNIE